MIIAILLQGVELIFAVNAKINSTPLQEDFVPLNFICTGIIKEHGDWTDTPGFISQNI